MKLMKSNITLLLYVLLSMNIDNNSSYKNEAQDQRLQEQSSSDRTKMFASLEAAQRDLSAHNENKSLNVTSETMSAVSHNRKEDDDDYVPDNQPKTTLTIAEKISLRNYFSWKDVLFSPEQQIHLNRSKELLSNFKRALVEDNSDLLKKITESEDFILISSTMLFEILQEHSDPKRRMFIYSLMFQKRIEDEKYSGTRLKIVGLC